MKDLNANSPDLTEGSPKLISISSVNKFKRFVFFGLASSIFLIRLKLNSCIFSIFLCREEILLDPKIIGVQKSNILLSLKVLIIISIPIPEGSPIEIPILIFDITLKILKNDIITLPPFRLPLFLCNHIFLECMMPLLYLGESMDNQ